MHLSKPAMFFVILLIAPTSLFTNALPADGDITEPIEAQYAVFADLNCPLTAGAVSRGDFITPNICVSLVLPSDPDNPSAPVISGYKSGLAAQEKLDTAKYDCKIFYYGNTYCVGFPVGITETIGEPGLGPCVNFVPFPNLFPSYVRQAKSVKLFCNPK